MKDNFQASLKLVLVDEGGNDDNPHDHGGRTSRGITQREYTAWLAENKRPDADVWEASQADVETIYHQEYWAPFCDLWPIGVDYCLFDMNVNAGAHRSAVLAQRVLNVVADGRIGPVTRAALSAVDPRLFIYNFAIVKRAWYRGLDQPWFTKGWLNRTSRVESNALLMLKGAQSVSS